jgi:hypothetical protein
VRNPKSGSRTPGRGVTRSIRSAETDEIRFSAF